MMVERVWQTEVRDAHRDYGGIVINRHIVRERITVLVGVGHPVALGGRYPIDRRLE